MHEEPDAAEVLRTVGEFLREEVLPAVEPDLAYRTRVAINLVAILEREQHLGAEHRARERRLLTELLEGEGAETAGGDPRSALCELLATAPPDPLLDRRAWTALMQITRDEVAVARPGYDAPPDGPAGGGETR